MNIKSLLCVATATLLSAYAASATVTADWTFETSPVSGTVTNANIGPFTADSGTGTASGHHASATTQYSSPAGNGSAHSLSANGWAVGDYYQFSFSTTGLHNILVSVDTVSSATGPRDFNFTYSLDGTNFTILTNYANVSGAGWSAGTAITNTTRLIDMSSVTAVNNQATVYVRLTDASTVSTNAGVVASGGTSRVDNFIVSGGSGTPPSGVGLAPANNPTNAGFNVPFVATVASGDAPYVYYFEKGATILSVVTNTAVSNTFTLSNVTGSDSGTYTVVVSNANGTSSASVAFVVNDPAINYASGNQTALPGANAQFYVVTAGTGLTYQWYYAQGGSPVIPITDGVLPSGAVAAGSLTTNLVLTGVTVADNGSNFCCKVIGSLGSVTSTASSLTIASTGVQIGYWDFNSPVLNPSNAYPTVGFGTQSVLGGITSFLTFQADPLDFATPNSSLGSENYPDNTANKTAGFQFAVSTVKAQNIQISYDVRGTATASKYHRLQYTTNGTTYVDFPTAATIGAASTYTSFAYNLNGFPGVANNPNFGFRIVSEFESTALSGTTNDANYVAITSTSTYGTGGTLSYDLVTVTGDLTNNTSAAPTITVTNAVTIHDGTPFTLTYHVADDVTPAGSLTLSASNVDIGNTVTVGTPANSSGTVTLSLSSATGSGFTNVDHVELTATDADGNTTAAIVTVTVLPNNTAPAFGGLTNTNMLPNTTLSIPFVLTDDHTPATSLTAVLACSNTYLVPNTSGHLSVSGTGSNRVLSITPITNGLGTVPITVSSTDGNGLTGSVTIFVTVRPNTNVVLVDNFDYDNNPGPLTTNSLFFWQTHSGTPGQLQYSNECALVSGTHSEDVNAPLIGAPYSTNSSTVLYTAYVIDYTTLPAGVGAGAYITHFKDTTTFDFSSRVWAFTNGVTPGFYRMAIANVTNAVSALTAIYPMDLSPNSNYVVVTRCVVSNGTSTLWINPVNESSAGVTDLTFSTNQLVNITTFAMRESAADEGSFSLSKLKIGTSFDSVYPSLQISRSGSGVVVSASNPTLTLTSSTVVQGPYTNVGAPLPYTNTSASPTMFYQLAP